MCSQKYSTIYVYLYITIILLSIFINLKTYYISLNFIFLLIISLNSFYKRGLLGNAKVRFCILKLSLLHRIRPSAFCHTYFISRKLERSVVSKALDSLNRVKIETRSLDLPIQKLVGMLKGDFSIGIMDAKAWLSGWLTENKSRRIGDTYHRKFFKILFLREKINGVVAEGGYMFKIGFQFFVLVCLYNCKKQQLFWHAYRIIQ